MLMCVYIHMCLSVYVSVSAHVSLWGRKSPVTAVLMVQIPDSGHIRQPLHLGKNPRGYAPDLKLVA